VFSATLSELVRSTVKLIKAGALFFLQLSINVLPAIATPQSAQDDIRKSRLSMNFYFGFQVVIIDR
jgi:hypothetical protein